MPNIIWRKRIINRGNSNIEILLNEIKLKKIVRFKVDNFYVESLFQNLTFSSIFYVCEVLDRKMYAPTLNKAIVDVVSVWRAIHKMEVLRSIIPITLASRYSVKYKYSFEMDLRGIF